MRKEEIDPYNEEDWSEKENLWVIYKPVISDILSNIFSSIPLWIIGLYFLMTWFVDYISIGVTVFSPSTIVVIMGYFTIILLGINRGVFKWVKWMNIISVVLMVSFSTFVHFDVVNQPFVYEKSSLDIEYKMENTENMIFYNIIDDNYRDFYFEKNDSTDFSNMELYRCYRIGFFGDTMTSNHKYLGDGNVFYGSKYLGFP